MQVIMILEFPASYCHLARGWSHLLTFSFSFGFCLFFPLHHSNKYLYVIHLLKVTAVQLVKTYEEYINEEGLDEEDEEDKQDRTYFGKFVAQI